MELHYKELGQGKPIIILHGLFGSSDNWLTIGKALADHHKIYLIDQRNHGQSFHSDEFNYQAMAADLKDFITTHHIEKPFIIGHSMGGKVAMNFAVKHPDLYDRIVVVDIAPRAYSVHHDNILEGLASLNLDTIQSRKEADEQLSNYVKEKGVRQFLLKNLTRSDDGKYAWKLNLPAIKKNIENIGKGLEGQWASDKPTLFIRGENSDYIKNEDSIVIESFFPNFEIKTIKNAGHWVHAEQPEAFLDVLNRFLK